MSLKEYDLLGSCNDKEKSKSAQVLYKSNLLKHNTSVS